jgi:putative multiple sugar transport system substrate-binding protein
MANKERWGDATLQKRYKAIAIAAITVVVLLALFLLLFQKPINQPTSTTKTPGNEVLNSNTPAEPITAKVGISVPTGSTRTNKNNIAISNVLESRGHTVDLLQAGSIETQYDQIDEFISSGCNILIVSPVNELVLSNALENAKANNITVIAYDKMILNTDAIGYFVSYDSAKSGSLHGEYLIKHLDLDNNSKDANIEIFPGDLNNGDISFYNKLIKTLEKYINSGNLHILSNQYSPDELSVSELDYTFAKARMEGLIAENGYAPDGTILNAVVCKNDTIAMGVIEALKDAGFTSDNFPLVTGGNCDMFGVKNMLNDYQAMSLFINPNDLGSKAADLVDALIKGESPSTNYSIEIDSRNIPAFLSEPSVCTKENYKEILLDSGYYDAIQ